MPRATSRKYGRRRAHVRNLSRLMLIAIATADIADYIDLFYNQTRRHSHLSGVSPEEFEGAVLRRELSTKSWEVQPDPVWTVLFLNQGGLISKTGRLLPRDVEYRHFVLPLHESPVREFASANTRSGCFCLKERTW